MRQKTNGFKTEGLDRTNRLRVLRWGEKAAPAPQSTVSPEIN